MKDYYYILGISKNAPNDEIKKAYRKLSMKFHPDQNQGDPFFEERFKAILEANEVLSNTGKRNTYDVEFNSYFSGKSNHQYANYAEQIKREYQEQINKIKHEFDKKNREFKQKEKELIDRLNKENERNKGASQQANHNQQIIDQLKQDIEKERKELNTLKSKIRFSEKTPTIYRKAFYSAVAIIIILGVSLFIFSQLPANETIKYVIREYEKPDFESSIKSVELLKTADLPIIWDSITASAHGQKAYYTYPSTSLRAKVFTNNGFRATSNVKSINNVVGVNHFFMDHDLVSGYVHPYTQNFFNKLRPTDFVGRFEWSSKEKNTGLFSWVQKKDLAPDDKLGQNLAFFRQWKLSEIAVSGSKVNIQPCSYKKNCKCMQVLKDKGNPYETEIPIPTTFALSGYQPLNMLNKLDQLNGGTATIIWLDNSGNIIFQDVHNSIEMIIAKARQVANEFGTDPTIAVGDAGPYSKKFFSNGANELDFAPVNALSKLNIAGAGIGYIPAKASKFRVTFNNGDEEIFFLPDHADVYELFMQKSKGN